MKKQTNEFPKYVFGLKNSKSVGIINPSYGYERVSYGLKPTPFKFDRIPVLPIHKFTGKDSSYFQYTPRAIDFFSPASLLHTWNALPISSKPFVVSFECELPRYLGNISERQLELGFKLLSSNRCRKILALSQAAADRFNLICSRRGAKEISEKVTVFKGGLSLPLKSKENYSENETLKLIFVGTGAFRKGIVPTLNACEELIRQGYKINLTVIGGLEGGCYVHREYIPDFQQYQSFMQNSHWINFMGRIPPVQVFKAIKEHDLMLFPSLDESLGWVPIEAALLGVPSITTDIFAFPELIEHQINGFLVSIEKNDERRFVGLRLNGAELLKSLEDANSAISDGIMKGIKLVYEDRSLIEVWGRQASDKAKSIYDLNRASQVLSTIYSEALI